jgi:hypothetical protein
VVSKSWLKALSLEFTSQGKEALHLPQTGNWPLGGVLRRFLAPQLGQLTVESVMASPTA